ncbi:hypothetical protein G6F66_014043 [Rhizopus arrhizus]|nr:hypothetical protein G6F66_014043 [Rhizopus arrhizus]
MHLRSLFQRSATTYADQPALAAGLRTPLTYAGLQARVQALAGWLPPRAGKLQLRPGVQVAYASQRPYLFHGSIADNLRLADPGASDARLRAVAEAAQVLQFAQRLPQGLDTVIGERGFGLSGGEARRIGLARLLLRDPQPRCCAAWPRMRGAAAWWSPPTARR